VKTVEIGSAIVIDPREDLFLTPRGATVRLETRPKKKPMAVMWEGKIIGIVDYPAIEITLRRAATGAEFNLPGAGLN
jgi:hypothetical protein